MKGEAGTEVEHGSTTFN